MDKNIDFLNVKKWILPFTFSSTGNVWPPWCFLALRLHILRRSLLRHYGCPGDKGGFHLRRIDFTYKK
jgi:hypothetical protein